MASPQQRAPSQLSRNFPHLASTCVPVGLDALYSYLLRFYPTQRNPLQVSTQQKYWLGGADPLDYVTIYFNAGDRSQQIPPHWHYVSMGLSDLHGDGRVVRFRGPNQPSGFGFELTFRLIPDSADGMRPPVWPAAMMQHLAKYVFRTGKLSLGDIIKWGSPLDGLNESRIQHILLVNDAQLTALSTPCGSVDFLQIVGICEEERKAVQKWNVFGVSELLRKYPVTGGYWLITDMRRGESVFDVDPCANDIVELGVASEGSNLSGIQALCWWSEWTDFEEEQNPSIAAPTCMNPNLAFGRGACSMERGRDYQNQNEASCVESSPAYQASDYYRRMATYMEHMYNSSAPSTTSTMDNVLPLVSVHLRLNAEAATFLPLALKGRLAHGRHFTFKSPQSGYGDITFVAPGVSGSFSTPDDPFAYRGSWLHVYLGPQLQELMLRELSFLESITNSVTGVQEAKTFKWPSYKLKITILPDMPGF